MKKLLKNTSSNASVAIPRPLSKQKVKMMEKLKLNSLPTSITDIVQIRAKPKSRKRLSEADLTSICIREVGERLAYLRNQQGMTLNEASQLTNISRAELSRVEKGERRLTESHLASIASAYSLPLLELRNILSYQVKAHVKVLNIAEAKPSLFETSLVPCLAVSDLMAGYSKKGSQRNIVIPKAFQLSSKGYAVELDHTAQHALLPPNSLVVVDPETRVRLGDLVLNLIDWSPAILKIERAANDQLVGSFGSERVPFPKTAKLNDFHKVILIMPGAGIFGGMPLPQE